jgi:uncharacterized protein YeeX (DUF496 family)
MEDFYIEDGDIPVDPPKRPIGRPKGSFKKKMNDAEKRVFLSESIKKILKEHMSYAEYVVFCREHNLSASQANIYWMKAWSIVKKKFELENDKLITKHLQRYWELYDKAEDNNDLNTARQILNDIAKLLGLNEPDKVHVSGTSIKLKFGDTQE